MTYDREGYDDLWLWFGLSRASFLVMPRVLMHAMSDEWQKKMAELLFEYDSSIDQDAIGIIGTSVRATDDCGKLMKMPDWLCQYRHPDQAQVDKVVNSNAITPDKETTHYDQEAESPQA